MSDKNKYYTPDISEFHVGFECETQHREYGEYGWIQRKFGFTLNPSIPVLNKDIKEGYIRVKKLDHEDITKCGWEITQKVEDDWTVFGVNNPTYRRLYLNFRKGITVIGDKDSIKFEGAIANINELKRIMQQIGI